MKFMWDGREAIVSTPLYVGLPEDISKMETCEHEFVNVPGREEEAPPNFADCTMHFERCGKCGASRSRTTGPTRDLSEAFGGMPEPPLGRE